MIDNSSNLVSFFHQFTFKSGFILIPKGGKLLAMAASRGKNQNFGVFVAIDP